ncbi:transposase [Nitrosomonas sp. Nm33]|uniref:REP-associated tyrosine transposase n=1 Tax=Nitrosomonas sp. Nm33 TaxID=133724 RepID=UPI0008954799|nr:transposase [Nitrosomonas sp. Nm33]SDX95797.1 putative transposase [Nitrosomonas sp. Nm33]
MSNYRRNRIPGGTCFFTVNLLDRQSQLLVKHITELREAVRITRQQQPFYIDAWVVLPDHLHCIWTLPPNDHDYSNRWRSIKKAFSKSIPKTEYLSPIRVKRHERGTWYSTFHRLVKKGIYSSDWASLNMTSIEVGERLG